MRILVVDDDQQIREKFLAEPQRLETVGGLAHHRDIRFAFEQTPEAAPDDAVIVSQQHAQAWSPVRPRAAAAAVESSPWSRCPLSSE